MAKGKYERRRTRAAQQKKLLEPQDATNGRLADDDRPRAVPKSTDTRQDWKVRAKAARVWLWSALWGLLCYVVGVISGPVIQQRFLALLPGPGTDTFLRAEIQTEPGKPNCHFYMFSFYNFHSIDYLHTKLQFPDSISSFKVGLTSETVLDDDDRDRGLQWSKGWNQQDRCTIMGDTLTASSDVHVLANGHILEIQSSRLPDPTHIVGLIATTTDIEPMRSKLWTEGEYEYSKFGQTIRKKLPIAHYIMKGAE